MLTRLQKINLAQNANVSDIVGLLNDCKTQIGSVIGKTEFETVVNALTLEVEAQLIGRFIEYIEDIKSGNFHEQE